MYCIISQFSRNNTATIDADGRTVDVRSRATAQEQTRTSHVLGGADAAQRDAGLDRVLELLQCGGHHLAFEGAAGKGVGTTGAVSFIQRRKIDWMVHT